MANEEQLAVLRQGVDVWNKWREENPEIEIDLSEARLNYLHYISGNPERENFENVNFCNANLRRVNLDHAILSKSNLMNANLQNAVLGGADLSNANLHKANLREAFLEGAHFEDADLTDANLRQAKLNNATLNTANLSRAILREASIWQANLIETNLTEAVLVSAVLVQSVLKGAILKKAKVTRTDFLATDLTEVDFSDADFELANLSLAKLNGSNFSKARMQSTFLGRLDLSNVVGLDDVIHLGPSRISIDTFAYSKGKIPEHFLRGCGLSDLDIEYAKLANPGLDPEQVTDITYKIHQLYLGGGIQYYSCFISYNSKDEAFARQLHDDLQDNGVRCWFAPEDMKIGDQIRPRIDQEIRLRDKLLVILSENSVKSEWVGDEVEGALEEEGKSNRLVLFPIRLDNTVMSTRDDWAAKIKRRRHIGDFSNWKDKASYQKAFERLLRDLKATGG